MIYKEAPERIDTNNANQFLNEMMTLAKKNDDITLDMINTKYISSACLRVFLMTYKQLISKGHNFNIINANELVTNIIDTTGLTEFLLSNNKTK